MRKIRRKNQLEKLTVLVFVVFALSLGCFVNGSNAASYLDDKLNVSGYLRLENAMSLVNQPDVPGDEVWDLTMLRTTLYVQGSYQLSNWARVVGVGQANMEYNTPYIEELDDMTSRDLMKEYQDIDMREWYSDLMFGKRLSLRLGKQIVSWGHVDFFRAMDRIHGEDWSWRSFFPSKEEIKRPLIMANMEVAIPELKGSLQVIMKPGLDRDGEFGDKYDIVGSRWATPGNAGFNFHDVLYENSHFKDGDSDDVTGGIRFGGQLGRVDYTLNYLRTLGPEPIFNPNPVALPFATFYKEMPKGFLGDLVYPEQDMFGFTANYYSNWADMLMRTEFVYILDRPYQVGRIPGAGGFSGVIEKDTLVTMFAFEKNLGFLRDILQCREQPLLLVQYYDAWILDYKDSDDIPYTLGATSQRHQNDPNLTVAISWTYLSGRIKPGLAGVFDLRYKGALILPSVDFEYGDHWRLRLEADLFYDNGNAYSNSNDVYLFSLFGRKSQAVMKLSYLF